MPVESFAPFPLPQVDNTVDFSPLANLGKQQQDQQRLADLARLSGFPPTPGNLPAGAPDGTAPSVGGTNAPFSAPQTTADVKDAIRKTAAAAGMDVPHWMAIASIESSLNPQSNYNKPTQYKGLFQLGAYEFARHGKGNTYDARDNAQAAASLAAANNADFQNRYGRAPTPAETYMMHQQGPGFYSSGKMTNIEGNPYPGMSGQQTPESFEKGWGNEIERRAKYFSQFEGQQ